MLRFPYRYLNAGISDEKKLLVEDFVADVAEN
jgi:hypothetical protein